MSNSNSVTQKEIVLQILEQYRVLRMEQIKIFGMKEGISAADVYARALRAEGKAVKKRQAGDQTETWVLKTEFDAWPMEIRAAFLNGTMKDDLIAAHPHLKTGRKAA